MGYTKEALKKKTTAGGQWYELLQSYLNQTGTSKDLFEFSKVKDIENLLVILKHMRDNNKDSKALYLKVLLKEGWTFVDNNRNGEDFTKSLVISLAKHIESDMVDAIINYGDSTEQFISIVKFCEDNDLDQITLFERSTIELIQLCSDVQKVVKRKAGEPTPSIESSTYQVAMDFANDYIDKGKYHDSFDAYWDEVIVNGKSDPIHSFPRAIIYHYIGFNPDVIKALLNISKKTDLLKKLELTKMTPTEYFDSVKNSKENIDSEEILQKGIATCKSLISKYTKLGQTKAIAKLEFLQKINEIELKLHAAGITCYIHKTDVTNYIEAIARNVIKIQDIAEYERDIPDDVAEKILAVSDLFTNIYIVFTDYTGKVEKQVVKERRDRDPIAFGAITDPDGILIDRMYYIGDWEDEFCDLTLAKMVEEMRDTSGEIRHQLTPDILSDTKSAASAISNTSITMVDGETAFGVTKVGTFNESTTHTK